MADITFVEGMHFDRPGPNAPDFIKGKISIRVEHFLPFAKEHQNERGYLDIDLRLSKEKKLYLALNEFKAKREQPAADDLNLDAEMEKIDREQGLIT